MNFPTLTYILSTNLTPTKATPHELPLLTLYPVTPSTPELTATCPFPHLLH